MIPINPFLAELPGRGHRLCIHTPPSRPLRGAVLHVHAFGEELNKTRRMAALGAQALASAGFAVLQIDLLGCGDSDGDFAEASWLEWVRDLEWAAQWLALRHDAPLTVWGLRAGALLAADLATRLPGGSDMLLWCPVQTGKAVVQQMLRLKAAANWASADGKAAVAELKAQLAAGHPVEIAGYRIDAGLLRSLEATRLAPPPREQHASIRRMTWLEVSGSTSSADLSLGATDQVARWRAAGYSATARSVVGPAFWQTGEVMDAPALVHATVAALLETPQDGCATFEGGTPVRS